MSIEKLLLGLSLTLFPMLLWAPPFDFGDVAVPVPEPSSIALFGIGVVAVFIARHKRK